MRLRDLFQENDEGKLVLPDFQRALEWKVENQKKLLASFIVYLPVGNLLTLRGNQKDFIAKKLCFPNEVIIPKEECLYLLDGQQRTSSLKSMFSDFFDDVDNWKDTWEKVYSDLQYRWFIRVKPQIDEDDIFGYNNLCFRDLKKCEPGDVIERIMPKKVYKTKEEQWYNPGFYIKDEKGEKVSENKRKNQVAKEAAKEFLVPLYSIYGSLKSGNKPLHTYVLSRIAEERVKDIICELGDMQDVNERNKRVIELLQFVEPDIEELINDNDEKSIEKAWGDLSANWSVNVNKFLNDLLEQEIKVTELPADEIGRAVSIFENINKGGTPLDTYDLIVAKAARNRELESLTNRVVQILEEEIEIPCSIWGQNIGDRPKKWKAVDVGALENKNIVKIVKDQYLNLLSIVSYTEYGRVESIKLDYIKRNMILEIDYEKINDNTEKVVRAIVRACAVLQFRCGIPKLTDLAYKLMILPIAYALMTDEIWNDKGKIDKIEYWYWSSLFGGAYREGQNEKSKTDIQLLYNWLNNKIKDPFKGWADKVLDDPGYSNEDVLLMEDSTHDIPQAIHAGILQYILSNQPKDFVENGDYRINAWDVGRKSRIKHGNKAFDLVIQDHHICPLGTATKLGESSKQLRSSKKHKLNSTLNRTFISGYANNIIKDKSPSDYLNYISDLAKAEHCVANDFKREYTKGDNEEEQEYYMRILKNRYIILKRDITRELGKLVDSM